MPPERVPPAQGIPSSRAPPAGAPLRQPVHVGGVHRCRDPSTDQSTARIVLRTRNCVLPHAWLRGCSAVRPSSSGASGDNITAVDLRCGVFCRLRRGAAVACVAQVDGVGIYFADAALLVGFCFRWTRRHLTRTNNVPLHRIRGHAPWQTATPPPPIGPARRSG